MSVSAESANITMDELDSITNLQRVEAFDDKTEALHHSLSKRGSLFQRKRTENSSRFSEIPERPKQENAEEKLLRIIANQTSGNPGRKQSPATRSSGSSRTPDQPDQRRRSLSHAKPPYLSGTKANGSYDDIGRDEKRRSSSSRRQSSTQQQRISRVGSDSSLSKLSDLEDLNAPAASRRGKGGNSVSNEPAQRKAYVSRRDSISSRRSSASRPSSSRDPRLNESAKSPQHLINRQAGQGVDRPPSGRDVGPDDRSRLRRPGRARDERDADSPPPILPSQIHAQTSRVRIASGKEYRRQSVSPKEVDTIRREGERSRSRSKSPGELESNSRERERSRRRSKSPGELSSYSQSEEKSGRRPRSRSGSADQSRSRSRSPSNVMNGEKDNLGLRNSGRSRSSSRDVREGTPPGKGEKRPSMRSQREIIRDSRNGVSRSFSKSYNQDAFDNVWGDDPNQSRLSVERSNSLNRKGSERSLNTFLTDEPMVKRRESNDSHSVYTLQTLTSQSKIEGVRPKKTKLEKIHELQAKCDRYKKEWIETAKDRKRIRKEFESGKSQVIALKHEIEIHKLETSILQKKLSEELEKVDEILDEQRKERADFSNAAKDLAESRIEFTKAINDTRELRVEIENLEQTVKKKDNVIADLEDELQVVKTKAQDLDSDLNFAEETVLKLEKDMKAMEKELSAYRMAADKNVSEDGDTKSKVEHLRSVRDQIEKKMEEDRERRLEDKRKKLDEKVRQFEEERKRFMTNERAREEVLIKQKQAELEDSKLRDNERSRMDEELNERLKSLEGEKAALQGRLKSEQLNSNVKLREKDDRIARLQNEFTQIQGKMTELMADPEGVAALQQSLSEARAETENLREELEIAKKENTVLSVEIEDLQKGNKKLQGDMKRLQKEVLVSKREAETWQRKSGEWEAKSGEWTDKAYLWKEKAEHWEKAAKDVDTCSTSAASESQASADPLHSQTSADPQAILLQAALEKKKATESYQTKGSKWGVIKNMLNSRVSSQDEWEAQNRIEELEAMNAEQAEIIKNLRSEMIRMQGTFKEKVYSDQLKMQQLVREREVVEGKNVSLTKELELARKLEAFANRDQ